jgi:hypothetical protein
MEREFLSVCDGDHAITLLFSAALRVFSVGLRVVDIMQPKTAGGVVIGTLPEWSVP